MSMSFADAYNMVQQGSDRAYKGARESQQKDIIGNILQEAQASGDPAVLQQSIGKIMSQVDPENRNATMQYVQYIANQKMQEKERAAASQRGLNPYLSKELQAEDVKQQGRERLEILKAGLKKDKVLKLNQELNQQKSRTKSKVDDIIRPHGMIDPFTRMITWNKDVGEDERKEINRKINIERKKSFSAQKNLYKRYGQEIPDDLEETLEEENLENKDSKRSEKVQQAVELLQQLMNKQ